MLRFLLASGANVNAGGDSGETALMTAAHQGYAEIARILLAAGAEADARDDDGSTALVKASEIGATEVA
ncbi:ankyrin repeat domain-containing protein [Candidatus Methylospira mobilis]|uniref:ankyrin repeat domain-containing protein n=1 Tax=Candidatus Methylospira mobilis TaxID=1808979 RepID=UPI0028ED1FD1|nr:ankyrin repeat domain-containing protein [Candidatus Methylospira mobilis]WNV05326.1 ankyrin repeat domain-containing protein [Candidatus Methylospira mobilis]